MNWRSRLRERLTVHSDFLIVLFLFVAFRLMMLMLFEPQSFLTFHYTDFMYYFEMVSLSAAGHYPMIDYWFEYPPVFPYYAIGIYQLTRPLSENFEYFARVLSLAMLPFEILVLVNVYRIARQVSSAATATRTAWIYSALALPVYFWQFSFDSLVVALTLQSLYWLISQRRDASALTLAIAIGTKFVPVFIVATAWRFAANVRSAVRYTLLVAAGIALIFLPFLLMSTRLVIASFQSLLAVSSWETVWALLDGNKSHGYVGAWERHFDPTVAGIPVGNPSLVPMWAALIPFALIFLYVVRQRVDRQNPRHVLIFTGIILVLFHLWSKGWSPQWATLVLPFLLLLYPGWRGVLFAVVFSFITLLDWPVSFVLNSPTLALGAILTRTGLFALLGIDLFAELRRDNSAALAGS